MTDVPIRRRVMGDGDNDNEEACLLNTGRRMDKGCCGCEHAGYYVGGYETKSQSDDSSDEGDKIVKDRGGWCSQRADEGVVK